MDEQTIACAHGPRLNARGLRCNWLITAARA